MREKEAKRSEPGSEARVLRRYYLRAFAAGRSELGRALDYLALRAVLFCAAYLLIRPRVTGREAALLLALIALLCAMIVLRLVREARFARFCARENARLTEKLLAERLTLLPKARLTALVRPLADGRRPCVLQCAEPADANALLACLRAERGKPGDAEARSRVFVCATAGFTKSARAFAAERPEALALVEPSALLAAAANTALVPTREELCAHIRKWEAARRTEKREKRLAPFAEGGAKKYLFAAAALALASFVARYALYYRLLAGFCMLLAVSGRLLRAPKQSRDGSG